MGWFALLAFKMCELTGFSSPSGDGLVLIDCSKAENYFAFSSPGGVGLVHFTRTILLSSICFRPRVGMGWFGWGICKEYFYGLFFVPAWGWGGSVTFSFQNTVPEIFVPAWGWVGSHFLMPLLKSLKNFRPRLGLGWFVIQKYKFIKVMIFVPAWGWVGSQLRKMLESAY